MIDAAAVWAEMGVPAPAAGHPDTVHMDGVVAAINAMVPRIVPRVRELAAPTDPWPADVDRGAVMLAARLFARRNSPTGVAAFTETGPAYVSRWDPDIERLLGIGTWAPPRVG